MSRVFHSAATGAGVYVFSDDHCPPHVHARHRAEGWIARIKFSYLTNMVELISIAPLKNIPLQRVLNMLLDEVRAQLAICRRSWWEIRQTVCLANQWAVVQPSGIIEIAPASTVRAKLVANAVFDPARHQLNIVFADGTQVALGGVA